MSIHSMEGILSQCLHRANCHNVNFKYLTILFVNYISMKLKRKGNTHSTAIFRWSQVVATRLFSVLLTAEYTNNHQIPMIKPSEQLQFHQIRPQVITVNGISTCTPLNNWFQTSQPVTLLVSFTQLKWPSMHSLPEKDPQLIKSIVQTLENSKFELDNLCRVVSQTWKRVVEIQTCYVRPWFQPHVINSTFSPGSLHTSPGYYFLVLFASD